MHTRVPRFVLTALLLAGALPPCARARQDEEIPVVGRPADLPFSGASGSFEVSARARPTSLRVGEPLTLTLTVRATAPVRRPPRPIDLKQVPALVSGFHVQVPPGAA